MFPFSLFTRPRRGSVRRARLTVEALDQRQAPSSIDGTIGTQLYDLYNSAIDPTTAVAGSPAATVANAVAGSGGSTPQASGNSAVVAPLPLPPGANTTAPPAAGDPLSLPSHGGNVGTAPAVAVPLNIIPPNQPPEITSFTANQISPGKFQFAGEVVDEIPSGMVVSLSGVPSVQGATATVQSNGSFSTVVQLRTDGSDMGTVYAVTVDSGGLNSNIANVNVYPV